MAKGSVKWFSDQKGYGFIVPDRNDDSRFGTKSPKFFRGDASKAVHYLSPFFRGVIAEEIRFPAQKQKNLIIAVFQ